MLCLWSICFSHFYSYLSFLSLYLSQVYRYSFVTVYLVPHNPEKIFQQCVEFIQNYISGNSAQPVNNYCVLVHEEGHNRCSRKHKLQSIFKHNLESTSLRANTCLFRSVRLSPVFAGLVHKQLLKTPLCCVS